MKNNITEKNYYQEDEIDLKELFNTLWLKKNLIIGITASITILAGIYAFNKTPIYEATALVEIGNYKLHNTNNKVFLESASELSQKLNYLYIKPFEKSVIVRDSKVVSISTPKKIKHFIEIRAEATSNQLATDEINKVIKHIQIEHSATLNDIKQRRESSIRDINRQIFDLKEYRLASANTNIDHLKTIEVAVINRDIDFLLQVKIPNINKKLLSLNQIIRSDQKSLDDGYQNFDSIKGSPTLASLRLNKLQFLESKIFNNKNLIIDLEDKQTNLQLNKLKKLEGKRMNLLQVKLLKLNQDRAIINDLLESLNEDKMELQSLLSSHNYKNTDVAGQIITHDRPAKPKKKLIVAMAFIAGFILSIFLVFIMNAFRKEDDRVSA
jgi:LPS O-antigen subunit length determinant protein (WzzB/FepE family)